MSTSILLICSLPVFAQIDKAAKDPLWTHAFDVKCRKLGEDEFTKDTQKFGVEIFKDLHNDLGLYVVQTGSFGVGPGFNTVKAAIPKSKSPEWLTGLDLPARKAGEAEFTDKTQVHALEVYRDENVNNWVYITEKGNIAVASAKGSRPGVGKAPVFSHSVDLSVRKAGVKDWKDATKFGVEVWKDPSTGNFVYICETGTIAVIPADPTNPASTDLKAPSWLHGHDLACRKHTEPKFAKDTQKFGVEVYRDENTGNLIFLCETGSIAVTAGTKKLQAPTANVKDPVWNNAMNVKARKVGQTDWTDAPTFGVEVFADDNLGVLLYINEKGQIAAVNK